MIIRSIVPHLMFKVVCEDHEYEIATDLANKLAERLLEVNPNCKGVNQTFPNLKVMKAYLEAL